MAGGEEESGRRHRISQENPRRRVSADHANDKGVCTGAGGIGKEIPTRAREQLLWQYRHRAPRVQPRPSVQRHHRVGSSGNKETRRPHLRPGSGTARHESRRGGSGRRQLRQGHPALPLHRLPHDMVQRRRMDRRGGGESRCRQGDRESEGDSVAGGMTGEGAHHCLMKTT